MTSAYRTDRQIFIDGDTLVNPIPVVMKPAQTLELSGSNAAVPANALTTIVSYTNVGTEPLFVDGWAGTGQYEGDWYLVIDTVVKPEDRSSASTMRAGHQFTSPIRINPGSIVDIKVEHYGGATGEFAATLYAHR